MSDTQVSGASGSAAVGAVAPPSPAKRGFWRHPGTVILGTAAVFGLAFASFDYLADNLTHESTDDAFLDGDIVSVAPKVAGQVSRVYVVNNQHVKAGDLLLELDPRDLQVTLDQKKAALASANANTDLLKSAFELTKAMVTSARATAQQTAAEAISSQATAEKTAADLKRARVLITNHTISPQEFDTFEAAAKSADASLKAALQKAASDQAKVAQAEAEVVTAQKAYERAEAQTRQSDLDVKGADLNLSYARVTAPTNGFVTKNPIVAGDYVQVGQRLLALVPDEFFVTANFKETQVRAIRPGQKVEISVDSIEHGPFVGHVESIMAGSGARFSLLPPENAVGNYVKVVQRIPVKILFDEPVKAAHVLGPGMSVVPSIRVNDNQVSRTTVLAAAAGLALVAGAIWFARAKRS